MLEIRRASVEAMRSARERVQAPILRHLDDFIGTAEHLVAHEDGEVVAMVSALPLSPRGRLDSDFRQLIGPFGDPRAFRALVDAAFRACEPGPRTLWSTDPTPGLQDLGDGTFGRHLRALPREPGAPYTASDIRILSGLEVIRRRPTLYIGELGRQGAMAMFLEILANAVDEAYAGHAGRIEAGFQLDRGWVQDDGRGIPVDPLPDGRSALETLLTTLRSGGPMRVHLGGKLYGTGLPGVNALCASVTVRSGRPEGVFEQRFHRGRPATELERVAEPGWRGTRVSWVLDPEIFGSLREPFSAEEHAELRGRVCELACFVRVPIVLNTETLHFPDGLAEWAAREAGLGPIAWERVGDLDGIHATVIACKQPGNDLSWCNGTRTEDGGSHLQAARSRLPSAGRLLVHAVTADPRFAGRTRRKLEDRRVGAAVAALLAT